MGNGGCGAIAGGGEGAIGRETHPPQPNGRLAFRGNLGITPALRGKGGPFARNSGRSFLLLQDVRERHSPLGRGAGGVGPQPPSHFPA